MLYCGLIVFLIVPATELRHLCWKQQQQPFGRETPYETVYYQLVNMQMELGALFVVPEVLIFSMKYSHTNKYPRSFPPKLALKAAWLALCLRQREFFIEALSLLFYF